MKITIEGEPKEIAALELALKDGKGSNSVFNCEAPAVGRPCDQLKILRSNLRKALIRP